MLVRFTLRNGGSTRMRACFLGQNVTALGFGVAMLQTPPPAAEPPLENQWRSHPEPERALSERAWNAGDAPPKAFEPTRPAPVQTPAAA